MTMTSSDGYAYPKMKIAVVEMRTAATPPPIFGKTSEGAVGGVWREEDIRHWLGRWANFRLRPVVEVHNDVITNCRRDREEARQINARHWIAEVPEGRRMISREVYSED